MAGRPLNTDEARLWGQVMATVRPLRGVRVAATIGSDAPTLSSTPGKVVAARPIASPPAPTGIPAAAARRSAAAAAVASVGVTLDAGWDRRLSRGAVAPDSAIDLHGHTLASAHALLDSGLDRAIGRGDRVLLLVTGKPPRRESERPHARGAIRAAVADWLAMSRHAGSIAAVRGAHSRHGGAGALYIVLRRPRMR